MNSRPWPKGYTIENPLEPPIIAEEIDIHVFDLLTMTEVWIEFMNLVRILRKSVIESVSSL